MFQVRSETSISINNVLRGKNLSGRPRCNLWVTQKNRNLNGRVKSTYDWSSNSDLPFVRQHPLMLLFLRRPGLKQLPRHTDVQPLHQQTPMSRSHPDRGLLFHGSETRSIKVQRREVTRNLTAPLWNSFFVAFLVHREFKNKLSVNFTTPDFSSAQRWKNLASVWGNPGSD